MVYQIIKLINLQDLNKEVNSRSEIVIRKLFETFFNNDRVIKYLNPETEEKFISLITNYD